MKAVILSMICLVSAAASAVGESRSEPVAEGSIRHQHKFFAMDTAVRNLKELSTVKQLGYDGISWKTGSSNDVASASKLIEQQGLKLFAVYAYKYAALTSSNLTWDISIEDSIKALAGTDTVIWIAIGSTDFPVSSADGDSIAVPALQRLADFADQYKLRIAIYPHKGCWTERIQDAVRVAKKVDRKNFGVTFNLCHCLMAGDEANIPALLTDAAPYLFLVTINGADSGAANSDWNRLIRPLDEGSYDAGIVIKKLNELKYYGPVGLQGYGVKIPVQQNLSRSIGAWEKIK